MSYGPNVRLGLFTEVLVMKQRFVALAVAAMIVIASAVAIAQATKTEQVKCPVCGLMVDKAKALTTVYKSKTYYFESKTDYDAFQKTPEKYAK